MMQATAWHLRLARMVLPSLISRAASAIAVPLNACLFVNRTKCTQWQTCAEHMGTEARGESQESPGRQVRAFVSVSLPEQQVTSLTVRCMAFTRPTMSSCTDRAFIVAAGDARW